jgi:hypothetical protein
MAFTVRAAGEAAPTPVAPQETVLAAPTAPETQPPAAADTQAPAEKPQALREAITKEQAEIYARKEKALLSRAKQLKAQEESLAARESGMVSRDRLAKEPLQVLAELGIKPHQLAESLLNAPQPLSRAEVELEALKAEIEGLKAAREQEAAGSVEQALSQIRVEAVNLVKADPRFETIQATGQTEEVVRLIKGVFDAEGTILSVEEAANMIETQLAQDEFKRYERLSKLSKIQKRLQPSAPAPGPVAPAQATEQKQVPYRSTTRMPARVTPRDARPSKQVRTLSNSLTSSTRELSSRERAILAFSNKLTG